ncbi:hypothetical protein DFH09DRAFT_1272227 [Mycena vulgaris]|nr:hypothetical protein DFH09DRAFT_1272227 [Mycena vulgaris]
MALAWLCLALAQHFPSQGQSQQQARPGQSQWLKPGLERKIFAQQFLRFWGPDELYCASVYYLNNLGPEIVGFTGHKSNAQNISSINSLGGARSGHGLTGLAWLGKSQARSQGQENVSQIITQVPPPGDRHLDREGRAICRIVYASGLGVQVIAKIFCVSEDMIIQAVENNSSHEEHDKTAGLLRAFRVDSVDLRFTTGNED